MACNSSETPIRFAKAVAASGEPAAKMSAFANWAAMFIFTVWVFSTTEAETPISHPPKLVMPKIAADATAPPPAQLRDFPVMRMYHEPGPHLRRVPKPPDPKLPFKVSPDQFWRSPAAQSKIFNSRLWSKPNLCPSEILSLSIWPLNFSLVNLTPQRHMHNKITWWILHIIRRWFWVPGSGFFMMKIWDPGGFLMICFVYIHPEWNPAMTSPFTCLGISSQPAPFCSYDRCCD